jgi:hypothetical protein
MEATQESTAAAGPAQHTPAQFAELARELVMAAEASARERTAEKIARMLGDIARQRAAEPEPAKVPRFVMTALQEAQYLAEAAASIVADGIEDGELEFPKLQALRAILQCLDEAVDPALESLRAREAREAQPA